MLIESRNGVVIGTQIDFARAMTLIELAIVLTATATVGNRSIVISVFDSEGEAVGTPVTAYAVVTAGLQKLLLFYNGVTEASTATEVLTDYSTAISVPAGGYITITDANEVDALDTITFKLTAK